MADESQSQTSDEAQQVGSAGGDVRQMRVGDLLDITNAQNVDVAAQLSDLISRIQTDIEAGNIDVGGKG